MLKVVHVLWSGATEDTALAGRRIGQRTYNLPVHHCQVQLVGDDNA